MWRTCDCPAHTTTMCCFAAHRCVPTSRQCCSCTLPEPLFVQELVHCLLLQHLFCTLTVVTSTPLQQGVGRLQPVVPLAHGVLRGLRAAGLPEMPEQPGLQLPAIPLVLLRLLRLPYPLHLPTGRLSAPVSACQLPGQRLDGAQVLARGPNCSAAHGGDSTGCQLSQPCAAAAPGCCCAAADLMVAAVPREASRCRLVQVQLQPAPVHKCRRQLPSRAQLLSCEPAQACNILPAAQHARGPWDRQLAGLVQMRLLEQLSPCTWQILLFSCAMHTASGAPSCQRAPARPRCWAASSGPWPGAAAAAAPAHWRPAWAGARLCQCPACRPAVGPWWAWVSRPWYTGSAGLCSWKAAMCLACAGLSMGLLSTVCRAGAGVRQREGLTRLPAALVELPGCQRQSRASAVCAQALALAPAHLLQHLQAAQLCSAPAACRTRRRGRPAECAPCSPGCWR